MKTLYSLSLVASTGTILAACSGGGGGDAPKTTPAAQTYAVLGTVPGTLIEAFCDDGSYYVTHSEKTGGAAHPFKLNLPASLGCRLVMTTNEDDSAKRVVTAIRVVGNGGKGSTVFTADAGDITLGFIPLAMNRAAMRADRNKDGVEDFPYDVVLSGENARRIAVLSKANDVLDRDGDGIVNRYDDDDEDGILDGDDDFQGNRYVSNDDDRDGVSNDKDVDDDNDGRRDDEDDDQKDDHDDDHKDDHDDDHNDDDDDNSGSTGGDVDVTGFNPDARLLASQCAQCHGTDGYSVSDIDSLAGESVREIVEEMDEMRAENDSNDIMVRQAHGYTAAQTRLIAEYFAGLPGGDDD